MLERTVNHHYDLLLSVTNLEGCSGDVQFRVSAAGPGGFGPPSMSSVPITIPHEQSERGTVGESSHSSRLASCCLNACSTVQSIPGGRLYARRCTTKDLVCQGHLRSVRPRVSASTPPSMHIVAPYLCYLCIYAFMLECEDRVTRCWQWQVMFTNFSNGCANFIPCFCRNICLLLYLNSRLPIDTLRVLNPLTTARPLLRYGSM